MSITGIYAHTHTCVYVNIYRYILRRQHWGNGRTQTDRHTHTHTEAVEPIEPVQKRLWQYVSMLSRSPVSTPVYRCVCLCICAEDREEAITHAGPQCVCSSRIAFGASSSPASIRVRFGLSINWSITVCVCGCERTSFTRTVQKRAEWCRTEPSDATMRPRCLHCVRGACKWIVSINNNTHTHTRTSYVGMRNVGAFRCWPHTMSALVILEVCFYH